MLVDQAGTFFVSFWLGGAPRLETISQFQTRILALPT
jgi:hypothetical protein